MELLRRQQHYIFGAILAVVAVVYAVLLLTFNAADPSFNHASDATAQNLIGSLGAFVADPLLQFFGLAAGFWGVLLLVWSVRLLCQKYISYVKWRISAAIIAFLAISIMLAYVPTPEYWPFYVGFGGIVGDILYSHLSHLLAAPWLMLSITVLLLPCLIVAFAVRWQEVTWCCRMARYILRWLYVGTIWLLKRPFKKKHKQFEILPDGVQEVVPVAKVHDIVAPPKPKNKRMVQQASLRFDREFTLPGYGLLALPKAKKKQEDFSGSAFAQNAKLLEQVLEEFGVKGGISKVRPGPVVTLYELEPSPGTKSSRVVGLSDDIARSMSAVSVRIAVIPGRNAIGIELPNSNRETVYLRELLETEEYQDPRIRLPIALGKDIAGETVIADLSRMPHLLIAGTTGSGKSVAINTMVLSFLYRLPPQECKFIMIDPKMLELSVYEGIPHLLTPVVTDPAKAVVALKWAVKEMENRYHLMSSLGVRNIAGYNKRIEEALSKGEKLEKTVQTGFDPDTGQPVMETIPLAMECLPFIVVVVDEMADLMLVAGKDIEGSIQRLAQMARAAGIHLIMATQRPSVDVITGVIKANFPTRISFQVTSKIDSRTILGEQGAEQLLGMGDMLYMAGGSRITRVHGPFVDDAEVEKVVAYLKKQGSPTYIEEVTQSDDVEGLDPEGTGDELYDRAVGIVLRDGKASTSYIQRQLKIGYNRAANIIEKMEQEGIVGSANHVGKREVLIKNG